MSGVVLAAAGSRANITRTILSCAGITIGVGALILIVTGGDVGERFAKSFAESNTGVAATYTVDLYDGAGSTLEDLDSFEADLRRAGGQAVSITSMPETQMRIGEEEVDDAWTTAVDAELGDIRRLTMASGRWFDDSDTRSLAPVMVVNEGLAEQIGGDGRLQIGVEGRWKTVRVVGVVEDSAMDRGDASAYLLRAPSSAPLLFPDGGLPESGFSFAVRADPDGADAEAYKERLLTSAWRWSSIDKDSVEAYRIDPGDQIETVLSYLSIGLGGIALITLSTGMLGVLNVGLVTVRERRRELATYRALGATSFALFIIVVTEAVVVSVAAGVVALVFCYTTVGLGGVLVSDYLPSDVGVYVPAQAVLVGLGSAALAGLLAGVIPAWRALRTSVVSGLRE